MGVVGSVVEQQWGATHEMMSEVSQARGGKKNVSPGVWVPEERNKKEEGPKSPA